MLFYPIADVKHFVTFTRHYTIMEVYPEQFSNAIAFSICGCINCVIIQMHLQIPHYCLHFCFRERTVTATFKSICKCISHVLQAMGLTYLNSNINCFICFFFFSALCM